jgi:hypothetical protein
MNEVRETQEPRLPPELRRYTLSPNWVQQERDEERRRRALEEFRRRFQADA